MRRWAGWIEAVLWLTAVIAAVSVCTVTLEAHAAQGVAQSVMPRQSTASNRTNAPAMEETHGGTDSRVLGRMEISALGLTVPVLEDDNPATLVRGVGRVPGTAVPGGLGNLVLAGHRDTFFRPLRHVRPGMIVQVVTAEGTWRYTIDSTEIVTPDQVSVLDVGDRPEMTLITCYPFDYIGAAPRRFIVHAHLLSADPS